MRLLLRCEDGKARLANRGCAPGSRRGSSCTRSGCSSRCGTKKMMPPCLTHLHIIPSVPRWTRLPGRARPWSPSKNPVPTPSKLSSPCMPCLHALLPPLPDPGHMVPRQHTVSHGLYIPRAMTRVMGGGVTSGCCRHKTLGAARRAGAGAGAQGLTPPRHRAPRKAPEARTAAATPSPRFPLAPPFH